VYQQIENYILARGSRRERCSCTPRSPSRPPGSAARLDGLVGALLALPAVAVLQTTISSYLRGHVIVDAD